MATIASLYQLRVFSLHDLINHLGMTRSAASGALARWQEQGIVKMVRRNLYVAIDLTTGTPIADKYELASCISTASYVGWHTALEFHGFAHQPFYNAFVANGKRFSKFRFEDVDYEYCAMPFDDTENNGIISPNANMYVRVTDIERTIVDCSDKIDRAGGAEELLHCINSITMLNESKLIKYLALYDKAFLYQKVGYILEQSLHSQNISNDFIKMCLSRGAIHTKRLTSNDLSNHYVSKWKLYVPQIFSTNNYELI